MHKFVKVCSATFALFFLLFSASQANAAQMMLQALPQSQLWALQDSYQVSAGPDAISTAGFATTDWYTTQVPSTVMNAILSSGRFEDPFFGTNFLKLPGSGSYYEVGKNYGLTPTPADSPFGHAWWYRTEFLFPSSGPDNKHFQLNFDGINYAAEIWLNGKKIANPELTAGTYRTHSFDVTPYLEAGKTNALAVLVLPPAPEDLTPSWVDWNPTPQDKNMGIWRQVYLSSYEAVAIEHPQVLTKLDLPNLELAHLSVEAEVANSTSSTINGDLRGTIEGIQFSQRVSLNPGENKTVVFSYKDFPQLNIKNPRLWWPAQMGKPDLYSLELSFVQNERVSDYAHINFGIRQIDSSLTSDGSRLFSINGKAIQIRGGGWASDIFWRYSKDRVEKELQYALDLGLNTIRLEGSFEPQDFLDLTDRLGILVMPGWVCCNAWQNGAQWPEKNYSIAATSMRDQIYQLRAHPSVFVFLYGSDEAPPENIEKIYVDALKNYHWPNPVLASAAKSETNLSGPSGVKMNGPYDYVPPAYWYVDKQYGGAFGFNTETSPGVSIPPIESLRQFIPREHLWPIDEVWKLHAGENEFYNIDYYVSALSNRYGAAKSVEDFSRKSQLMAYDNHRAMFEAFGKNKYHSATGIIQWMLNNSWPSLIWHLYDYYLRPAGSYFGVKKANEPLHIQYSYDDQSIVIVNSSYSAANQLTAKAELFDLHMHQLFTQSVSTAIEADSAKQVIQIPEIRGPLTKTYFLRLSLKDHLGTVISNNFYWLSTQKEVYDWKATDFKRTPITQDADLTALNTLPTVQISVDSSISPVSRTGLITVTNSGNDLAFFIHLKLIQGNEAQEILPILWEDNYISLIPGETRKIRVRFPNAALSADKIYIQAEGWNTTPRYSLPAVN